MSQANGADYLPRPEENHLFTAILFREDGRDFLYVATLGAGCQGQALLVRQIRSEVIPSDDEEGATLFVRKRAMRRGVHPRRPSTPPEIKYPRPLPHNGVPVTHCWKSYSDFDRKHNFSSIQDFCNGGSLEDMWDKFANDRKFIPELFLWEVLESLGSLIDWIHNEANPPVAHHDINLANIFLHYTEHEGVAETNPEVFLGDFGYAIPLVGNDVTDAQARQYVTHDVFRMTGVIICLAAAGFGSDVACQKRTQLFADWSCETPYSSRLVDAVCNVRRMCTERLVDSRSLWEIYLRNQCWLGKDECFRNPFVGSAESSVGWTKPDSKILGDQTSCTTDDDKGKLGILPPFSYVLVNPETLEIVRERAWQEIAMLGPHYNVRGVPMSGAEVMNIRAEGGSKGKDEQEEEEGGSGAHILDNDGDGDGRRDDDDEGDEEVKEEAEAEDGDEGDEEVKEEAEEEDDKEMEEEDDEEMEEEDDEEMEEEDDEEMEEEDDEEMEEEDDEEMEEDEEEPSTSTDGVEDDSMTILPSVEDSDEEYRPLLQSSQSEIGTDESSPPSNESRNRSPAPSPMDLDELSLSRDEVEMRAMMRRATIATTRAPQEASPSPPSKFLADLEPEPELEGGFGQVVEMGIVHGWNVVDDAMDTTSPPAAA